MGVGLTSIPENSRMKDMLYQDEVYALVGLIAQVKKDPTSNVVQ